MHGEQLCPFKSIKTQFGEGIEFNYAKTTRLVINAFCLEDIGKTRPINISASINAAKLSKTLTHTSSGLKMSDISGRNPMKNNQCFILDDSSLQDLQSRNTIFLMKIVLTKETKDSFKLFEDVFQFFRLAGLPKEDRLADEKNLPKYEWQHLNDLRPLEVTSTTDMSADWKLRGVGGGVKKTKMFCTLCPCSSEGVHQPAETQCLRFCHDIELLSDELLLRNLSPRGELEELRQLLLQEIMLEHKLQQHLEKLLHCDKLVQCIIALLHKISCILYC